MHTKRIDVTDLGREGIENPTERADVAIELVRQTHEMTATMGDLRLRTSSDEPVHSHRAMSPAAVRGSRAAGRAAP